MGADLQRLREGKKTKTGMSEDQLSDFASKPLAKEVDTKSPEYIAAHTGKHVPWPHANAPDKDYPMKRVKKEDVARAMSTHVGAEGPRYNIPCGRCNKTISVPTGGHVCPHCRTRGTLTILPKDDVKKSFSERIDDIDKAHCQTCKCGSKNITHNKSTQQTTCHECGRTFNDDSIKKIAPLLIAGARLAGPALARAAAAGVKTAGKAAATQYGTKVGEHLAGKTNQKIDEKVGKSLSERLADIEKANKGGKCPTCGNDGREKQVVGGKAKYYCNRCNDTWEEDEAEEAEDRNNRAIKKSLLDRIEDVEKQGLYHGAGGGYRMKPKKLGAEAAVAAKARRKVAEAEAKHKKNIGGK